MTYDDSLISVLGAMGLIPLSIATELGNKCRCCNVPPDKTCGECPSEDIGIRYLLATKVITAEDAESARAMQARLRSPDKVERLAAAAHVLRATSAVKRTTSKRCETSARRVASKTNSRGYSAVKPTE